VAERAFAVVSERRLLSLVVGRWDETGTFVREFEYCLRNDALTAASGGVELAIILKGGCEARIE